MSSAPPCVQARSLQKSGGEVPPSLWAELLCARLGQKDCSNKVGLQVMLSVYNILFVVRFEFVPQDSNT